MEEESVWRALSSPIRRRLLDLLKGGPRSTNELARSFPTLSRYAVMQHLGVLEEASLILVRRHGRQRLNYLNAVPIRNVYERWVSQIAGRSAASALALQRYVERGREVSNVRTIEIKDEIKVKAPLDRVWAAMTKEQLEWYPHTYGRERVKQLVFEERVGGRVYEDWGADAGKLYSVITYFDPPKVYATTGHLRGGIVLENWIELAEDGDQTVINATTICFGEITEGMEEQIRIHGSVAKYEDRLKKYVETA